MHLKAFCGTISPSKMRRQQKFHEVAGWWLVMQTARLGAVEPLSRAIILASQADKSAPGSKPLRPARAMPQVVYMSDLLYSFKPSENIIKHCLQGPSAILNIYICILLARAILQACFIIDTRR